MSIEYRLCNVCLNLAIFVIQHFLVITVQCTWVVGLNYYVISRKNHKTLLNRETESVLTTFSELDR